MKLEIEDISIHYENLLVKFKGKRGYFYMSPQELIGKTVVGSIKKLKTRTWFIGDQMR